MWLPPFLAKPANAPQEHADLQPPVKRGHSFHWMFGHPDIKDADSVWPAVHQCEQFFRHQHRYTIPVIVQAWQNDQAQSFSDLRAMDGGLVLAGDCR